MLKIKEIAPEQENLVEGDHSIPLAIEWPTGRSGNVFGLGLEGSDGGDVELDVDDDTGSVRRFVVLIVPPSDETLTEPSAPSLGGHVIVDPALFADDVTTWMKTNFGTRLRWRDLGDRYLVQLLPAPASRYVTSGSVRIGLTDDNLLATLSAPKPDLDKGLSI